LSWCLGSVIGLHQEHEICEPTIAAASRGHVDIAAIRRKFYVAKRAEKGLPKGAKTDVKDRAKT
jgi:hypothetical protein